ncbi:hypothetical protein fugu_013404 [Takifugu bimaculatus]|uniref:Uncharacterized protein n=1 Tax=Takifugu bimaculatus TaxID=433685 RepID=A0A4Z2C4R7_9TELE|nr:hypothetical protein fugu_013404 [Takifugu bimaculatus]
MPTPALAGLAPPPSPLGSDCHRKHKHSHRKQQKSKLFPCVEKGERITGRGTCRRDDANEKMRQLQSSWDALGVMWLALRGFASYRTLHKTVCSTRLLPLTATVTGKQLDCRGGKRTPMNEVVSMAYLMEGDSYPSTSPLTTN